MTRNVPADMQAHLDGVATSTCRLLKITTKSGTIFGLCTLDQDVTYDDGSGDGPILYVASNGFDPSAMAADLGYSVGNAEGFALLSDEVPGVEASMIRAGEFDDAQWRCMLVNFEALSDGHVILGAGDLGDIRGARDTVWLPELLDYIMRLKQPIGGVDSRTCRAIFGTPAASQTGCGIDITGLWVNGTVVSVGVEDDRTFVGSAIGGTVFPVPGRVQWLTGDNAGREYATEEIGSNGISLFEPTQYPIQPGDTYRIRPDCAKRYLQDCIGIWNNGPNFKGEPYIPVGDALQGQTPGAQLPGAGGSKFGAEEP